MVSHKVNDESDDQSDYGDSIPLDSLTDKLIQNEAKSDYGESIPLDPATDNIMKHGITDIEDTPFTKFRSGTLNVSDFIDPRYCEHKFYFQQQIPADQDMFDDCNVVYEGRVIPVIMQGLRYSKENMDRGKSIRKEMELEVCAPFDIPSYREEEAFANTLVEICRRLYILIHSGMVREMPVMGRIGNEIVYGSVNELRRISISESAGGVSSKTSPSGKSHDIHVIANHSKNNSNPLPASTDHSTNVLQAALNKDLLDGMLASFGPNSNTKQGPPFPTLFSWICHRLSLDPDETFSDVYIAQLQQLEEDSALAPLVSLPKGLTAAKNIRDLVEILGTTISQLGLGGAGRPTEGRTSDAMRIVYVARRGGNAPMDDTNAPVIAQSGLRHGFIGHPSAIEGIDYGHRLNKKRRLSKKPESISRLQIFHHHDVMFDRQLVQLKIASMLKFWHGQRKMSGPTGRAELDSKCGNCPFRKNCPQVRDQYPAYVASGGHRLPSPDMP